MQKQRSSTIRNLSNFVLLAVPGLHLLSILWLPNRKYWEPLGTNLAIDYALGVAILVANLLFFVAIWLSTLKKPNKLLLMLIAVPFLCMSSYRSVAGHEKILTSVELDGWRYHLTTNYNISDSWNFYTLYRCYTVGGYCFRIESFSASGWFYEEKVELVADQSTGQVHVFQNGYIEFTYHTEYQDYELLDESTISEYQYRLLSNTKPNVVEFVLTRCKNATRLDCEVLYSSNNLQSFENANLVLDSESKMLNIIVDKIPVSQISIP